MYVLLSILKEFLFSSLTEEFIFDNGWDISRVPIFWGQGESGHSSTFSPSDFL